MQRKDNTFMERIDDLGINGLKLIQDTDLFCFGTDAVYLANFARAGSGATVVDFCTGNGIIPVLLSAKTKAKKIIGIEIQAQSYDLAARNVTLNKLDDRLCMIHGDVKNCTDYIECGSVDVVTCNPPYMNTGAGFLNPDDAKAIARHEILIDIDTIVLYASKILKFGGHFYMVHRADRLCDIMCTMRKYRLEPKRVKFLHPSPKKAPNLVLIEGMLGANPSLKFEDPEYVNI